MNIYYLNWLLYIFFNQLSLEFRKISVINYNFKTASNKISDILIIFVLLICIYIELLYTNLTRLRCIKIYLAKYAYDLYKKLFFHIFCSKYLVSKVVYLNSELNTCKFEMLLNC